MSLSCLKGLARGLALGCSLALAHTAWAETFTVTTTLDSVDVTPGNGACADAGGNCSLRAAIQEANATPSVHDEIQVPSGVYRLMIVGIDDQAAKGDLDVLGPLTIVGVWPTQTTITAKDASGQSVGDRLFEISGAGDVLFEKLGLEDGAAPDGALGGAVLHKGTGTVTMRDCLLKNNQANLGGAVAVEGNGTLDLVHSNVTGNTSPAIRLASGHGFVFGSTVIQNLGVGIENKGVLDVVYSAFVNNTTGIENTGTATVTSSTFAGHSTAGLDNNNDGVLSVLSGTVHQNRFGLRNLKGAVKLQHTIVVDNTSGECAVLPAESLGYNLIGTKGDPALCGMGPSDITGVAGADILLPGLSAAEWNGKAHFPLKPDAANKAVNAGGACNPLDQLERARIGLCDIGAAEAPPFCGDGVTNGQAETCDDANSNDGDGCTATCQVVSKFTVTKSEDTDDGSCDAADCSLREAVIAANKYPTFDAIYIG
ncbi:MAG: CSLREA domain-containing protein, partial [Deltaproteobacteria bacterium]|nr:CSLREA domain-containing protein [Deltaproteobacteria bacterium]